MSPSEKFDAFRRLNTARAAEHGLSEPEATQLLLRWLTTLAVRTGLVSDRPVLAVMDCLGEKAEATARRIFQSGFVVPFLARIGYFVSLGYRLDDAMMVADFTYIAERGAL